MKTMTLRAAICATALFAAAGLLALHPAVAATTDAGKAACGKKWKDATAAKTVPAGQTKAQFLKQCADAMAKSVGTTTDSTTAAATTTTGGSAASGGAATAGTAAATTGTDTAGSTTASGSATGSSGTQAATTASGTTSKTKKAAKSGAGTTTAAAGTATTTKSGKKLTPAQIAHNQNMKTCGTEWKTAKAAGKVPANEKWPQYMSDCLKRLKTAEGSSGTTAAAATTAPTAAPTVSTTTGLVSDAATTTQ